MTEQAKRPSPTWPVMSFDPPPVPPSGSSEPPPDDAIASSGHAKACRWWSGEMDEADVRQCALCESRSIVMVNADELAALIRWVGKHSPDREVDRLMDRLGDRSCVVRQRRTLAMEDERLRQGKGSPPTSD